MHLQRRGKPCGLASIGREADARVDVRNVRRRLAIEPHVAVDAREPPVVLVFQVGAITPAHDLHDQQVRTVARRGERRRRVELDSEA